MEPDRCESRADAIRILKKVLVLPSDLEYEMVFLWDAHTYMREMLPSSVCLYLAFDGPKSSGKTTATKCAVALAFNGKMLASITPAALKRLCDSHATLGIDEVDAHAHNDENLETILRVGNSWDAKAELCDKIGGKWENVETNVGGPKVFNFRGDIDDALRSRCLVSGMPTSKSTDIIIDSLYLESILLPVKQWLEHRVAVCLSETLDENGGWSPERVERIMRSDGFKARVSGIEGALARNKQQAAILLMVNDMMSWNLDKEIKEAIEAQLNEDPYELEKEILADFYKDRLAKAIREQLPGNETMTLEAPAGEVKEYLNNALIEKRRKPLNNHQWGILQRECGWQDGVNKKKVSKRGGKHILIFDAPVLEALGIENVGHAFSPASQESMSTMKALIEQGGMTYDEFISTHPELKVTLDHAKERGIVGIHPVHRGLVWLGGGAA